MVPHTWVLPSYHGYTELPGTDRKAKCHPRETRHGPLREHRRCRRAAEGTGRPRGPRSRQPWKPPSGRPDPGSPATPRTPGRPQTAARPRPSQPQGKPARPLRALSNGSCHGSHCSTSSARLLDTDTPQDARHRSAQRGLKQKRREKEPEVQPGRCFPQRGDHSTTTRGPPAAAQ